MMSKQVTKKSFLSGSPSRVDIRYKNLYIDSQKKVLVTCDLVKHLFFVFISLFVISFSPLMFLFVFFFPPHMQVVSLTEENKQLGMKLENALCKVEAVCLCDPFYITFLFFFVSWLVQLCCFVLLLQKLLYSCFLLVYLVTLCCEYKPEPAASYYHQIMHLCSLQG